eukprot:6212330-Pleurochrysis_carterae.AAC.6
MTPFVPARAFTLRQRGVCKLTCRSQRLHSLCARARFGNHASPLVAVQHWRGELTLHACVSRFACICAHPHKHLWLLERQPCREPAGGCAPKCAPPLCARCCCSQVAGAAAVDERHGARAGGEAACEAWGGAVGLVVRARRQRHRRRLRLLVRRV